MVRNKKLKHEQTHVDTETGEVITTSKTFNIKVNQDELEMFGTFSATAVAENDKTIKMIVYIVKKWEGKISPMNETKKIAWINSNHPENMKVGSIFEHKVIPKLNKLKMID